MGASSQCEAQQPTNDQPTSMDLLNTSLKIIASFCSGASLHDQTTLETQSKQHVRQLLLEPLLLDPVCTPPSPHLVDAPTAVKEFIACPGADDCTRTDAGADALTSAEADDDDQAPFTAA